MGYFSLLGLLGLLALSACNSPNEPEADPNIAFRIYDLGRRNGRDDRLTPLNPLWQRHQDDLAKYRDYPKAAMLFESGYMDGFDQHPEETIAVHELAYDAGYRQGRRDRWADAPAGSTDPAYLDAYHGQPHRLGRPY
jgi:hypothetical protein